MYSESSIKVIKINYEERNNVQFWKRLNPAS